MTTSLHTLSLTKKRKLKSMIMKSFIIFMSFTATIPLFIVFYHVIKSGIQYIQPSFFTSLPTPIGQPGGGMANALVGSLKMIGLACVIGIPIGVFGGVFLSEYGKGKIAYTVKFVVDLMTSIPSIVVGLYIYSVVVVPMKGFSAYAGSLALTVLMFPIIVKTTEEVLKLIPQHTREAGLALGIPRWRVILSIILKGSIPSVATGVLLAIARVSGETAPLILTAFGNRFWSESLSQPTASLPVQIYSYAISPFEEWHQQAWAGAFMLLLTVFTFNLVARLLLLQHKSGKA